jgi:hypothetical protein
LLKKLGKDSIEFELQVWVPQAQMDSARSTMVLAIAEALKAAEITMM